MDQIFVINISLCLGLVARKERFTHKGLYTGAGIQTQNLTLVQQLILPSESSLLSQKKQRALVSYLEKGVKSMCHCFKRNAYIQQT